MSKVRSIPDGYHSVQAYLVIKNCAAAIEFYKKVFGVTERKDSAKKSSENHVEEQSL